MSIHDRRSAERYTVNAHTACDFASPVLEDFGPVKILNISTTGVGFVTPEEVQPDLLFVIRLVNSAKKFVRMTLVRLVHGAAQDDGTCLVGAQFESPLSNEEFCTFAM